MVEMDGELDWVCFLRPVLSWLFRVLERVLNFEKSFFRVEGGMFAWWAKVLSLLNFCSGRKNKPLEGVLAELWTGGGLGGEDVHCPINVCVECVRFKLKS